MVPNQELVKQIQENIEYFCSYLSKDEFPSLQSCIAIDGIPSSEALDKIREGVHMMVATPERLMDVIQKDGSFGCVPVSLSEQRTRKF